MDPQEATLIQMQQAEIVELKGRVAALEQTVEHMRDMIAHLSDHVGFSHPNFGDGR